MRDLPCGEGAATEQRTTEDCHLGPSKLPDAQAEGLQEARGVPLVLGDSPAFLEDVDPFGVAGVAENTDMGAVEPSGVGAYERGGALPVVDIAPVLAESTLGIELAGKG